MIGRSVARRYLAAALKAAGSGAVRDELGSQLRTLQHLLASSPDVRRMLGHPTMDLESKLDALAGLLERPPVEPLRKLIELLIDSDRLEVLEVGADVYQQLVDESEGVVRAFVTTAVPMADEQSERLARALSAWLGQNVVIDARVDRSLLGGIAVRVEDRVLDASLRGRLDRIRARLVEQ